MKRYGWLVLMVLVIPAMLSLKEEGNHVQDRPGQVVSLEGACPHGVHLQENGPFAVLVSCEDALGSYLGVMHYGRLGVPVSGKWSLGDRFWQEKPWAQDVTAYAWSSDGKNLYVSTSGIYGEIGIYQLDLPNRTSRRIYPTDEKGKESKSCELRLKSIDAKNNEIEFTRTCDQESETLKVAMPSN
jgi:hypothetical protein